MKWSGSEKHSIGSISYAKYEGPQQFTIAKDPINVTTMVERRQQQSVYQMKVEPVSADEFEVNCRLCTKVFASEVALQNHARVFHIDAYLTGNPKTWTDDAVLQPSPRKSPSKTTINPSQMSSIVKNLSNENISYIIIKTEPPASAEKKRRKIKKEKEEKPKRVELKKEPEPITGPFECLEPSTVGSDGVCHQMFFSCCEYSEHQLTEHARPRRQYHKCQVCERPLCQLHQDGAKGFYCENLHCGKVFDTEEELTKHKNDLHIPKKRFECTVCFKKFSAQGGVVQHMRMHTGDRPYHCTFCPKAFTQKSGLEQHIRTHTKVKPFRCVICSKTFVQTVHLKQHMRTHTNVAPFQCALCDKRFKQSSHLNYHLKNHLAHPPPDSMTDEQRERYREIVARGSRKGYAGERTEPERSSSMDRETALAEQSIKEEGTYEVSETYSYVDDDCSARVVCVVDYDDSGYVC